MRGWWVAGVAAVAASWALCCAVQAVAGDPLPPQISISQYGVGPHGWLFSLWMLAVASGPCLLYRYRPVRGLGAGWWLLTGTVGTAVMAIVRTDPGGLQQSVHAKIHLAGSVFALAGLPIGIMLALLAAAPAWRRSAIALVAVSAVALELLLLSAGGLDTTGSGAASSWAFWQSVALAADMLLLVAHAFGALTIAPLATDPEPWWTAHRAGTAARDPRGSVAGSTRSGPRDLHTAGSAS
jgi:hypothetical protein